MTKEEAIKFLQQLYPNGGHCWLDEQRIEAIGMAIKALQEEPASEEQVKELTKTQHIKEMCKENGNSLTQELASDDLWEASKQYALRQVFASTDEEMSEQAYLDLRLFSGLELAVAHKDGAEWQKQKNESKVLTEEQCRKMRDDAFELGKDAMKQQLMAKAVEGGCFSYKNGFVHISCDIDEHITNIKFGDKIKVIVIKED